MSTVIKAGQGGTVLRRLSTVDLADHLAEARAVIEDARRRAAQVVARSREEAERAREDARREGYESGRQQGLEEGRAAGHKAAFEQAREKFTKEQADLVADLRRVVEEIDAVKDELRLAGERELLAFAVRLATKMTFAIGQSHRQAAIENLRRAIDLVGAATDLTVRVSPDDRQTMETFAEAALRRLEESRVVRVVADDSIAPGGCVVESGPTRVDATLETQTAELVALLMGGEAAGG